MVEGSCYLGIHLLRGRRLRSYHRSCSIVGCHLQGFTKRKDQQRSMRALDEFVLPQYYDQLTMSSALSTKPSIAFPTFFATFLTSNGSKRDASSSLLRTRAAVKPSWEFGGLRLPPEKAAATLSFIRFEQRLRYCDSKDEMDRSIRTVSGLE